ncbi:cytochrome c biogenesis protein ResB [Cellulomonas pakistanensis]|uniref:Cytochrome c biogenesis protein ResB n=1 Tax=Cellulomonas pakistanensis TaxID=992287 RepID=A0A919P8J7_9CELL|nr:cytochrome c biogenesis protein ResB [Cellulomonas pakistanensis]GIG36036.1 cytochrome c biogenesis protein ResB [Cellulomonas pakistanensis]
MTRDRQTTEPSPRGYTPEGLEDAFSAADPAPATAAGRGAGGGAGGGDGAAPALPSLGLVGWLRWGWRQLTSMRVALLLLMLLAVAAVPGTIFPQRSQDPADVATYLSDHPDLGPVLDRLGFFGVYSSVWFSAIYLLLFVSLVGCILPRSRTHLRAMRGRPPRAPRRFDRFPAQASAELDGTPEQVAQRAAAALGGPRWWRRFRVDVRDEGRGVWSVAAERGYLRETGNLLFHLALVGLLVSIATGQLLHFRGQAIVVEGRSFANTQSDYDTFESGAGFSAASLTPFSMRLDSFESSFDPATLQSRDFTAHVTVTEPGADAVAQEIKVNHPIDVDGAKIYLQGNGYAPQVTVRDADGAVTFSGAVPFLPQDTVYTSQGVIKVPDVTSGPQIGLQGVLLPTAEQVGDTLYRSVYPQPTDPLLALAVWTGDLGLDDGVPQNVYQLDETGLTQAVDDEGLPVTLYLRPGETVDLPDGLGTLTFDALPRFVALDLRHDPSLAWVLTFALLAFAGLAASLFVPRRRVWLRLRPADAEGAVEGTTAGDEGPGAARTVVSAAALARGDDVGLQAELDRAVDRLRDSRPPSGDGPTGRTGR